jgi:hypothetical protein
MASESNELTFVRCPTCRSLVPASAAKCRICNASLDGGAKSAGSDTPPPGRVRQKTVAAGADEIKGIVGGSAAAASNAKPVQSPPVSPKPSAPPVTSTQVAPSDSDFDPLGAFLEDIDDDGSAIPVSESQGAAPVSAASKPSEYSPVFDDSDDSDPEGTPEKPVADKNDFDLDIFDDPILNDLLGGDDDLDDIEDEDSNEDNRAIGGGYDKPSSKGSFVATDKPEPRLEQRLSDDFNGEDDDEDFMSDRVDFDDSDDTVTAPVKEIKPSAKPPVSKPIQRGPLPRKVEPKTPINADAQGNPPLERGNRPGPISSKFSPTATNRGDTRGTQQVGASGRPMPVDKSQTQQQSAQGRVVEQRGAQGSKDPRAGSHAAPNSQQPRIKQQPNKGGAPAAQNFFAKSEGGANRNPHGAPALRQETKEQPSARQGGSDKRSVERVERPQPNNGGQLRQRDRAEVEDLPKSKTRSGRLFGWLVSYENPDGRAIELREGRFFITGSTIRGADLILEDQSISTPHALVSITENGMQMQDLMSDRGTFVRAEGDVQYVRQDGVVHVNHGDWIRFGDVEFLVVMVPG